MAEPPSFTAWLRDGERIVWAAAAVSPRALRRLGIPPRSTAQLLRVGVGLTALAALVVVGATWDGLEPALRAALIASGALPPLVLGAWALAPRGQAYAFTDGGRGFLRRGKTVMAFSASATPHARVDPDQEAGDLAFGVLPVDILAGPRAGEQAVQDVSLHDVPYPRAVLEILAKVSPGAA